MEEEHWVILSNDKNIETVKKSCNNSQESSKLVNNILNFNDISLTNVIVNNENIKKYNFLTYENYVENLKESQDKGENNIDEIYKKDNIFKSIEDDKESNIENKESNIENKESNIENKESNIENKESNLFPNQDIKTVYIVDNNIPISTVLILIIFGFMLGKY